MSPFRKTISLIALSIAMLMGVGTASAYATPTTTGTSAVQNNQISKDDVRGFFLHHGVEPRVADRLIHDFENGKVPDSLGGVEPVSSQELTADGQAFTKLVYPDGSVAVVGHETGSSSRLRDTAQCKVAVGSGYRTFTNCQVYNNAGFYSMQFYANFTLLRGAPDRITWHGAPACAATWPANCDTPYYAAGQTMEYPPSVAWVSYQMRYTTPINTSTARLTLKVGNDNYSSSYEN